MKKPLSGKERVQAAFARQEPDRVPINYCFAPTHCLQDNSPTANVVAMYETAHRHGRY